MVDHGLSGQRIARELNRLAETRPPHSALGTPTEAARVGLAVWPDRSGGQVRGAARRVKRGRMEWSHHSYCTKATDPVPQLGQVPP